MFALALLACDADLAAPEDAAVFGVEAGAEGPRRGAALLDLASDGPLVAGQVTDLRVTGALPGETVRLGRSLAGIGPGPCPGPMGGRCLDLLPPVQEHGQAVADGAGVATFPIAVPAGGAGVVIAFQGVALRGPGGADTVVSPAWSTSVQPAAGGLEIVLVGQTDSVDYPVTPGAPTPSFQGGISDGFVARIDLPNAGPAALRVATYVGGSDLEQVRAAALASDGSLHVTGRMASSDLPTTPGVVGPAYLGGGMDAFLVSYLPAGGVMAASYLGGGAYDVGYGISVDAAGDVVVSGRTSSTDLPTDASSYQRDYAGGVGGAPYFGGDFFAMGVTADASAVSWATYVGGSADDMGRGRNYVDASGVYVEGRTESSDWPTSPGAAQVQMLGQSDGAVVKLDPTGSTMLWSTFLGGAGGSHDAATGGIVAAPDGRTYVCGYATAPDYPVPPAGAQPTLGGGFDGVVVGLSADGSTVLAGSFLGGSGYEECQGIALDPAGNVIVMGLTTSADFPVTANALQPVLAGPGDIYVAKLTPDLSRFLWATYLGGSGNESADASGVWVDVDGSIVLTANTDSADLPVTPDAFQPAFGGGANDAFVVRLRGDGLGVTFGSYHGGSGDDFSRALAVRRY